MSHYYKLLYIWLFITGAGTGGAGGGGGAGRRGPEDIAWVV